MASGHEQGNQTKHCEDRKRLAKRCFKKGCCPTVRRQYRNHARRMPASALTGPGRQVCPPKKFAKLPSRAIPIHNSPAGLTFSVNVCRFCAQLRSLAISQYFGFQHILIVLQYKPHPHCAAARAQAGPDAIACCPEPCAAVVRPAGARHGPAKQPALAAGFGMQYGAHEFDELTADVLQRRHGEVPLFTVDDLRRQ